MSFKIQIDYVGLRKFERELSKNIKKVVSKKLPPGTQVTDGNSKKIAKKVVKKIEKAFKNAK